MKLSIAMCTYNGAAYLSEQLESLAAQTRLPDELVVCDDRSNDDGRTVEIIKAFALKSPFQVLLSDNRKTLGSKKNFEKAISRCRGDIIFLCDQDDVWRQDKLARFEDNFSSKPETGLVFSDAEVVDEKLRPLSRLSDGFGRESSTDLEQDRAFSALLPRNLVTGATMAFRSSFRRLMMPIPNDTILQHDAWIALIIAAVAPVVFLKEPLIKYRQHGGQQIGVSIKGTRYEQRSSPLIDAGRSYVYPAGEIDACKTVYARLITKCSGLVTIENLKNIKSWIVRLENEKAVLENEAAPAESRKSWEEMQQYLDSRIISAAPYIRKDIWRLRHRLRLRDLRAAAGTLSAHQRLGIKAPDH